jgi:Calcineurin-like phosphoesterase
MLEGVERIPVGVRMGVLVLSAAAAIAGTIAHDKGSDDEGSAPASRPSRVPAAASSSPYLGPRGGGHGWMPSRAKRRSVVWAIGDGGDGGAPGRAVADMVASHRVDRLLYLGDVYDTGTASEFASNYRPLYGRFDDITASTIGNHEWPNVATGYVPYWTAVRGTPPPLWYAFAASGWQLISLNSNSSTSSAQLAWLRREIRKTPRYGTCRLAFSHHPIFSAGLHGDLRSLRPIFGELHGHASIVLAGHDHDMQRLHPIDGITPFVDGAGGKELYPVNRDDPRLAFFDDTDHGALRIQLRPGHAALRFVTQNGRTLDRSAVTCRQG